MRLQIRPSGARYWVYRTHIAGKRSNFGIGSTGEFTLAEAREEARELRRQVRDGSAIADVIVSLVREPGKAHIMGTKALERVTALFSEGELRRGGESFLAAVEAEIAKSD